MNWTTYFAAVGTFVALSVVGAIYQRKQLKKILSKIPPMQAENNSK